MANDKIGLGYNPKDKAVYCENCAYLEVRTGRLIIKTPKDRLSHTNLICTHHNNTKFTDCWLRKEPTKKIYVELPKIRNGSNNCKDFAAR